MFSDFMMPKAQLAFAHGQRLLSLERSVASAGQENQADWRLAGDDGGLGGSSALRHRQVR
jgi:hypothetical protein